MELSDSSCVLIENPAADSYFKTQVNEWSEWELKTGSLRKPQFSMYALVWAKTIWQNAMLGRQDNEDGDQQNHPRELYDARCTEILGPEGLTLNFKREHRAEKEHLHRQNKAPTKTFKTT